MQCEWEEEEGFVFLLSSSVLHMHWKRDFYCLSLPLTTHGREKRNQEFAKECQ